MHTIYILKSLKDGRSYVGVTNNFSRRFQEHQTGRVISTKHRRPFVLIFKEQFADKNTAKRRELWWKSGAGRRKMVQLYKTGRVNLLTKD